MKTFEQIMATIPASAFADRGRFAPKLDFAQRCEILALYKQGVGRKILADAFGIDRRTVTHIYNPASPHYKEVRAEFNRLGEEDFRNTYVTEGGAARVASAISIGEDEPSSNAEGRRYRKHAGVNMVKTEYTKFEHRIMIDWREHQTGTEQPGWYYQDLDGDNPSMWLHNGPESMKTSQACLKAVKENLSD
jgi:hypothetical protein